MNWSGEWLHRKRAECPGEEVDVDQYGIYFDDVARIDGEWKFTHRRFVPLYICGDAVTGNVLTQRSSLLRTD